MAVALYRYQVVCVGMWRGKIKRWNTTLHSTSSNIANNIRDNISASCWPNPGDVTGACSGGVASISVYNASGGSPISKTTYFDWETPGTWIPYTGTAWSGIDPDTPIDASGESAMVVVGVLPGLSSSGKPMTTRKYIHAVPSRTATDYLLPDIPPSTVTSLKSVWPRDLLKSPSGIEPIDVIIEPYYGNHQRVRGRRRTTTQVAAQAFSLGVLAGGGATTSGQGNPFPGGEF